MPPVAVLLSKSPAVNDFDLSSLYSIFVGAAPMGKDLVVATQKRLNIKVIRQGKIE